MEDSGIERSRTQFMRAGTQSTRYVAEHIERTRSRPLTERQRNVLAFVRGEVAAGREFPANKVIQLHFGWRYTGAAEDVLLVLACHGLIKHVGWQRTGRGKPRRIWHIVERSSDE